MSQGVVQTFHATRPRRRFRARTRRSRAARPPRRSRSSSSGTNGGGYYNSNSAVPFENPNGLSNFFELLAILLIPAGQVFMFGKMVGSRTARLDGVRGDVRGVRDRRRRQPAGRAARLAGPAQLRREHHPGPRPERRQLRRQGGPLRPRQLDALDGRDERRLERLRQQRLRRPDAGRRRRPAREPLPRRGDLRRGRLGPLRDVLLHHHRRLHRRADGRANAGMARQEDRGA